MFDADTLRHCAAISHKTVIANLTHTTNTSVTLPSPTDIFSDWCHMIKEILKYSVKLVTKQWRLMSLVEYNIVSLNEQVINRGAINTIHICDWAWLNMVFGHSFKTTHQASITRWTTSHSLLPTAVRSDSHRETLLPVWAVQPLQHRPRHWPCYWGTNWGTEALTGLLWLLPETFDGHWLWSGPVCGQSAGRPVAQYTLQAKVTTTADMLKCLSSILVCWVCKFVRTGI